MTTMIICKICNPNNSLSNGYCAEHSTSGIAYIDKSTKPNNEWKEKFKKEFYEGDDYTSNKYANLVSFIEFEILPDLLHQQKKDAYQLAIKDVEKNIKKVFDKRCIVNKFGEHKYWNRDDKNKSWADD